MISTNSALRMSWDLTNGHAVFVMSLTIKEDREFAIMLSPNIIPIHLNIPVINARRFVTPKKR